MAKLKWTCDRVERKLHALPQKEFQQVLAEISNILYRPLASSNDCPKSTESCHKESPKKALLERTGTDG